MASYGKTQTESGFICLKPLKFDLTWVESCFGFGGGDPSQNSENCKNGHNNNNKNLQVKKMHIMIKFWLMLNI